MKANLTDSAKLKVKYMGSEKVFSFNPNKAPGADIATPKKLAVQKGGTSPVEIDDKMAHYLKADWKQAGAK